MITTIGYLFSSFGSELDMSEVLRCVMLQTRAIGILEAEDLYDNFMKEDFPEEELKPFSFLQDMIRNGQCRIFTFLDHHKLVGYAVLTADSSAEEAPSPSKAALLDYLAVRGNLRNHGIGSWVLRQLPELISPLGHLLIEIEDPDYAETDAERSNRNRRRHFYMKNNVQDTEARTKVNGMNYRILDLAAFAPVYNRSEAEDAITRMYREVLPECWNEAEVH
ncbi:MAG: GNAT family N-acetyltransferase [Eubacteriales bacterium]|nr:GNAT family N-acetyltransferase [Eubacteriales bacterium]